MLQYKKHRLVQGLCIHEAAYYFNILLANLGDQELCKWLTMAISTSVMLLWLHLIHNNLGALELFQHLGFDGDAFKIRLPYIEFSVALQGEHSIELNLATWFSLQL